MRQQGVGRVPRLEFIKVEPWSVAQGVSQRRASAKCVLAAGADRGVLAALRDDVAGGEGPAVAWILEASGGGGAPPV